jgi:hypothetical protein
MGGEIERVDFLYTPTGGGELTKGEVVCFIS